MARRKKRAQTFLVRVATSHPIITQLATAAIQTLLVEGIKHLLR